MLSNLLLNDEEGKSRPINLHLLKIQLAFFCNKMIEIMAKFVKKTFLACQEGPLSHFMVNNYFV